MVCYQLMWSWLISARSTDCQSIGGVALPLVVEVVASFIGASGMSAGFGWQGGCGMASTHAIGQLSGGRLGSHLVLQ